MTALNTAALVVQVLLKYGPAVAEQARVLMSKDQPTKEDYDKLFKMAEEPWVEATPSEIKPV